MISGLEMRAQRQAVNKATCEHYAYPVWVVASEIKYQARCLGCEGLGPVVSEGPQAARRALRSRKAQVAA